MDNQINFRKKFLYICSLVIFALAICPQMVLAKQVSFLGEWTVEKALVVQLHVTDTELKENKKIELKLTVKNISNQNYSIPKFIPGYSTRFMKLYNDKNEVINVVHFVKFRLRMYDANDFLVLKPSESYSYIKEAQLEYIPRTEVCCRLNFGNDYYDIYQSDQYKIIAHFNVSKSLISKDDLKLIENLWLGNIKSNAVYLKLKN